MKSREIHLQRRPAGLPVDGDFSLVEVELPAPGPGQMLIRNLWMSVDPYMRNRMTGIDSYIAAFKLGEAMTGGAIGRVVQSNGGRFEVGELVEGMTGWREGFLGDGRDLSKITPGALPLETYLGIMGMTGLTAYVGLLEHGRIASGQTVFVSAAAGAVGSAACQIARLKGCTVLGSAGSDAKVAWLRDELGVAAFNYKTAGDLEATLARLAPGGIDVYFDNVGGPQLDAALARMKQGGRVAMCGAIHGYNAVEPPPGPRHIFQAVSKRLTLKGFIVSDHWDRMPKFRTEMGSWIAAGKIKWRETVLEGIENAPKALIGLFGGDNIGKMLVRLARDG